MSPEVKYVRVRTQHSGDACGFHILFNAKCAVNAILGVDKSEQLTWLARMQSDYWFWTEYERLCCILEQCQEYNMVNEEHLELVRKY